MSKVTVASFVGALLEWYDFFLFGTASALVFGELFFPTEVPTAGTAAAFATFGVGFIARPVGGIVFGHFGDRVSRKTVLVVTVLVMGLGTFFIGVLPTYETIGLAAPVLLVILRLAQGFGLGGEYAGAALLTIEHAPEHRKGFWGSLPQAAPSGAIMLNTGAFALVSAVTTDEQFLAWGWRLPFLVSIVLLAIALFIRVQIAETPEFNAVKSSRSEARVPLFQLVLRHPKNIILALGARLGETASSNIINAFTLSYLTTTLALERSIPLNGQAVAAAIGFLCVPLFGALSDRVGRKPLYISGAVFGIVFAVPFFLLLNTESTPLIWLALIVAYVFVPTLMFAAQSVFFAELFGANVRYTGLSVAYQVSAILGGFTPLVATILLQSGGGRPWYVAAAFAGICLLTLVCVLFSTETRRFAGSTSRTRTTAADS